jgi:hypothetical protein
MEPTDSGHQRILLAGLFLRSRNPVAISLAVAETKRVDWLEVARDLAAFAFVQELFYALPGVHRHMVPALRADLHVPFKLRSIKHRGTGHTFGPKTFGNIALVSTLGTYARRH